MTSLPRASSGVALVAVLFAAAIACSGSSQDAVGKGGGADGDGSTPGSTEAGSGDSGPSLGTSDGGHPGPRDGSSALTGDACAATVVAAKRAPANLLFLVDRSGSMSCNPPPTQTSANCEQFPRPQNPAAPTKWIITRDALRNAIAALRGTPSSVGLTYFSAGTGTDSCSVQATPNVLIGAIDTALIGSISSSLAAVVPQGLTPLVGAVTLGYQHLHESPQGRALKGRKFVVLITDGFETCAPEMVTDFVNQTVVNARLVGISTFVVGAPGSEDGRSVLSRIAFNGGTSRKAGCVHTTTPASVGDCHFDLTDPNLDFATELPKALDAISREAMGCEFDVPQPSSGTLDYGAVNVSFTPSGTTTKKAVPQDGSAACDAGADGWQYSADMSKILLCGNACTAVKNDPGGKVSIELGCATIPR